MKKREKTHILKENYQKLDETWKNYFYELTQDLVRIHNGTKIFNYYSKKKKLLVKN